MYFDPYIESGSGNELESPINDTGGDNNGTNPTLEKKSEEGSDDNEEPHQHATREEVINALEKAFEEDRELHIKLINFTNKNIWYYFYSGTIRCKDANDVFQEVIEKIIKGPRHWNKNKTPNIVEFILMVIVSHIRNERKKKEICEESVGNFDDIEQLREANLVELIRETARQDAEDEIFRETHEELIEKCLESFTNDETAYFVLDEILDGEESNQKIAAKLGITVNDVSNAKRRIKYRIMEILKK